MKNFLLALLIPLCLLSACRQKDVRATVVRVPQATDAAVQANVKKALGQIDGIDVENAVFTNGLLYVRYDSMKLGIRNIEHAIKDAGYDANDFKGEKK